MSENLQKDKPVGGSDFRMLVLLAAITALAVALLLRIPGTSPNTENTSANNPPPDDVPGAAMAEPLLLHAEFEPQEALILGGTQLIDILPRTIVDIVAAVRNSVRVEILVGSSDDRQAVSDLLRENDIPATAVSFLEVPVRSMWVRDFGPIAVQDSTGGMTLVDFIYRERRGNVLDNTVPESIAGLLDLPVREFPLMIEGGDFIGNGRGLCISSMRVIERNMHYNAYPPEKIGNMLSSALGFEQWIPLEHLDGEATGHLDMFLTMVAPDVVVVGECDPAVDSYNAELLDRIAANFEQIPTRVGELSVVRMPMPPHDDGVWRTYTNVVFANDVLLVPAYPSVCPDLDARAREIYAELLPGRKIVGIDCDGLIAMNGALRCITMNLPRVARMGSASS